MNLIPLMRPHIPLMRPHIPLMPHRIQFIRHHIPIHMLTCMGPMINFGPEIATAAVLLHIISSAHPLPTIIPIPLLTR